MATVLDSTTLGQSALSGLTDFVSGMFLIKFVEKKNILPTKSLNKSQIMILTLPLFRIESILELYYIYLFLTNLYFSHCGRNQSINTSMNK